MKGGSPTEPLLHETWQKFWIIIGVFEPTVCSDDLLQHGTLGFGPSMEMPVEVFCYQSLFRQ